MARETKMGVGDLVKIERSGNLEQDLMYAGFKAKVLEIHAGGEAFVDLDAYSRETGTVQAVSGSTLWPIGLLRRIDGCTGQGDCGEVHICE